MTDQAKLPAKLVRGQASETVRTWSHRFIELAGSALDFPYPPDPPAAEAGPRLD